MSARDYGPLRNTFLHVVVAATLFWVPPPAAAGPGRPAAKSRYRTAKTKPGKRKARARERGNRLARQLAARQHPEGAKVWQLYQAKGQKLYRSKGPYPLYANRAQGRQPAIGSVVLGKTSYFVRAQSFQRWSFAKMKIGRLAPQQRSKPFVFGKTLKPRVAELERTMARGFPGELGGFDKAMGGLPARHLGTAKPGEVFSLETTTGLKDVEVLSPRGVSGSAATAFEYLGQTRPRTRGKSETQVVSFQVPKSGTFKARFAPSGLHSFYVIEKATGNQFTARKFTIEIQR